MKPTLNLIETNHRAECQTARRKGNGWPQTDYNFKPNSTADFSGRCQGSPAPSFRRISEDYFKHEAPAHFMSEAAVFGVIALTAAVPMVQGIRGAAHFLRALGVL